MHINKKVMHINKKVMHIIIVILIHKCNNLTLNRPCGLPTLASLSVDGEAYQQLNTVKNITLKETKFFFVYEIMHTFKIGLILINTL